jgi:hypothetical protein
MAKRGWFLTERKLKRIVTLLAETNLTILEIAERMACSRSIVAAVNRKFQVRKYRGRKVTGSVKKKDGKNGSQPNGKNGLRPK